MGDDYIGPPPLVKYWRDISPIPDLRHCVEDMTEFQASHDYLETSSIVTHYH